MVGAVVGLLVGPVYILSIMQDIAAHGPNAFAIHPPLDSMRELMAPLLAGDDTTAVSHFYGKLHGVSYLAMLVGFIALHAHVKREPVLEGRAGGYEQAGYVVGVIALALAYIGNIFDYWIVFEYLIVSGTIFFFGLVLTGVATIVFAVGLRKGGLLSRRITLAMLISSYGAFAMYQASTFLMVEGGGWFVVALVSIALWWLMLGTWAVIGFTLWRAQPRASLASSTT